jgi:condensin complex subunit 3
MDGSFKLDTNQAIPPTPAPRSVWTAAPSRRRARQAPSSSDESDADGEVSLPAASVRRIPATPSMTAARSQRASKTAALSKMSAKPAGASSESELDGDSEVTSDEET